MLVLYHAPTSVCSQKVRLGFAYMGLGYESRLVNIQKGEQFTPEYLALNPDAVVPTLVDGELVVVESSLILAYLDREHNGARLMPSDRAGRVRAEHWLLRCIAIHAAINTLSFSAAMGPQIRAEKTDAEIDALAAKFPDPIMGAKRRDLILNGLASPYVGQAMIHMRRTLNDLEAQLQGRGWLGGEAPNIEDVALVAYIDRIERLGLLDTFAGRDSAVARWLDAWKELPAYETGIGAHVPEGYDEKMRAAGRNHGAEIARLWKEAAA